MTPTAIAQDGLTAEQYLRMPARGIPTELVRGRVVEMNLPVPRHGQICGRIDRIVGNHADAHRLGHVLTNDSGIITRRGPDTVRGPDVSFFSHAILPPGPLPTGYLEVVPELVFEVLSPSDRWVEMLTKVAEYLQAGVQVVCVLDPTPETLQIFQAESAPGTLRGEDSFHLPDLLGVLRVPVRQFFE